MAISYRGASNAAGQASGSAAASTVSLTPTLPSGAASGDRIYVYQVGTTTSGTTPTGWTVVGTKDTTLGSGAAAAGTGLRRATWYYRDYDGVWSMPAFTLTSTANNSHWVGAVAITPSAGFGFDTPTTTTVGGAFNAATTSYTDSSAASFTTHSDGFLLVGTGLNDNAATSAGAVTQTGATFGTVTERCDGGTSTGFTVAGKIHTCSVTTGASATITHTETIASSQGETLFVEQTETALPKIATLTDDFASADSAKWDYTTAGVGVSVSAGQLHVDSSAQILSVNRYDPAASSVYFQIPTAGTFFYISVDSGSAAAIFAYNLFLGTGELAFGSSSSPNTSVTYNATNHKWLRISESGGTYTFEASPDRSSWSSLGTAAISLPSAKISISGDGTVVDNVNTVPITAATGTIASTLQKALFSGSGAQSQTGTIAASVQNALFSGSGTHTQSGTVSALLKAATMAASADQAQTGTVAALLRVSTFSASGNQPFSGTVASQIQKVSFSGSGAQSQSGTISSASQKLTMSAAGSHGQSGAIASAMTPASLAASASSEPQGNISSTLQRAAASLAAEHAQTGLIQSTLQRAAIAASGLMPAAGTISATAQKSLFTGSGSQLQSGSMAAVLKTALFAAAADQLLSGVAAGLLQPAEIELLGSMKPEGVISSVLQRAVMSTGTGLLSQSGQMAAVLGSLDFVAAGLSKFFNPTPADRVFHIMVASRLVEIMSANRLIDVDSDSRLIGIPTAARTTEIKTQSREVSGG